MLTYVLIALELLSKISNCLKYQIDEVFEDAWLLHKLRNVFGTNSVKQDASTLYYLWVLAMDCSLVEEDVCNELK